MTFREKLADWISGGALSDALHYEEIINAAYERALKRMTLAEEQAYSECRKAYVLRHDMHQIAALETPHANATVRKMAKIAREAVK